MSWMGRGKSDFLFACRGGAGRDVPYHLGFGPVANRNFYYSDRIILWVLGAVEGSTFAPGFDLEYAHRVGNREACQKRLASPAAGADVFV